MTAWNSLNWTEALSSRKPCENRRLVEFAAWLSCHSTALVARLGAAPEASLQDYWLVSRARWKGWMQSLKRYHAAAEYADTAEWEALWKATRAVAAEVFASEPLTRVWGAVLATSESVHRWSGSDGVTRCLLSNHMAAADYVVNLLDNAPRVPEEDAAELKHLYQHSRRWCDLILAPVIMHAAAEPFAVDPQRSAEFHATYFTSETRPEVFWGLFGTSVQLFFRRYSLETAPSGDTNREILRSILRSLPTHGLRREAAGPTLRPHAISGVPRNGRGRLDGLV